MLLSLSVLASSSSSSQLVGREESATHANTDCLNGTLPKSVEVVVIATCVLSMIGAGLIVLSYVLIREIRTKAREILVHLSLMDFMYATANLVGIAINFERFSEDDFANHSMMKRVCLAQAAFASFGTTASVFWTIALAVYVYLIVLLPWKKIGRYLMISFYFICYGISFIIMLWFTLTGKLGFTKYGGSGWCSILVFDSDHQKHLPLNNTFGSDLWVLLAIFLVPTIFIALKFHLRHQVKASKAILTRNVISSVHSMEVKLMLIPVFFIFLRIWSLIFVFIMVDLRHNLPCHVVMFFTHINGIGDSGQGFANAILFVVFTPKVRRHFIRLFLCYTCWSRRRQEDISINTAAGGRHDNHYYGSVTSDDDRKREYSETTQDGGPPDAQSLLLNTSQ